MFAVIWINPQGKRATDKIVVCNPLLQRLNAAWAVLQSKAHRGLDSVVLSGDPNQLREFVDALERRAGGLDNLDGAGIIARLKDLAKLADLSTVEFDTRGSSRISGPRPKIGGPLPPPNRPGALDIDEMKLPPPVWEDLLDHLDEAADDAEAQGDVVTASRIDQFRSGLLRGEIIVALRKSPQVKLYPQHVTKQGKKIWDKVVIEQKAQINQYKSKEQQWAAALILFQREAAHLGVKPFTIDPNLEGLRKRASKELNSRLSAGNAKASREADGIFKALKARGQASLMTKQQFYEAVWYRGKFYLTTSRTIKLNNSQPGDVLEFLNGRGYDVKLPLYSHRTLDNYTDILFEPQGAQALYCFVTAFISRDNATLLFGLGEDANDNEIVKHLNQAGRRWVKTGTLIKV